MKKLIKPIMLSWLLLSWAVADETKADNTRLETKLQTKHILENPKQKEVLWIKLTQVENEGQFNKDVRNSIIFVWKKVKEYLPKWIKWKAKWDEIKVYYEYNF